MVINCQHGNTGKHFYWEITSRLPWQRITSALSSVKWGKLEHDRMYQSSALWAVHCAGKRIYCRATVTNPHTTFSWTTEVLFKHPKDQRLHIKKKVLISRSIKYLDERLVNCWFLFCSAILHTSGLDYREIKGVILNSGFNLVKCMLLNESNAALHQWKIKVMLQWVVYMKGSITCGMCELPNSTILTAGKCLVC